MMSENTPTNGWYTKEYHPLTSKFKILSIDISIIQFLTNYVLVLIIHHIQQSEDIFTKSFCDFIFIKVSRQSKKLSTNRLAPQQFILTMCIPHCISLVCCNNLGFNLIISLLPTFYISSYTKIFSIIENFESYHVKS